MLILMRLFLHQVYDGKPHDSCNYQCYDDEFDVFCILLNLVVELFLGYDGMQIPPQFG